MPTNPLGVVVPCYRSADVIGPCLDSLMASEGDAFHVVVCDNASPDGTVHAIRAWAARNGVDLLERGFDEADALPGGSAAGITLLVSEQNRGFAGAVNPGLVALLSKPGVELAWVLNPDTVVSSHAAAAYVKRASEIGPFSLMGGRTLYREPSNVVQSDGGIVNRWTGVCSNVNQGTHRQESKMPDAASLDFISGANMVASREFVEAAGTMREDYFLYYEEVDWAFRRGDLPLAVCPGAVVEHHGGTSIGTGSVNRRPSGFANYYNFRNRMRFVARFMWPVLPIAYAFSMAKVAQLLWLRAWDEALGAFRGLHQLPSPECAPNATSTKEGRLSSGAGECVIVNFHGIGEPHAGVPVDEVPYWISEELFTDIVDRVVDARAHGRDIGLTFDDGNRSDIEIAAPVLMSRGLRADFFVLTGRVDEAHYLGSDELKALVDMGMGVGLHGQDHVDWRRLDAGGLRRETVTARDRLADLLGKEVSMVSVPFGAYDHAVLAQLRSLGYDEIHTSDGGTTRRGRQVLSRTSIRSDMTSAEIDRILSGREPVVARVRRRLAVKLRQHVAGRGGSWVPGRIRSFWKRLMLRDTAFGGRYGRLRRLYSLEDPWDMASEREQHRFEQSNKIIASISASFANVLELGSGEGHQSVYLSTLTDDLHGLELSSRAVERARARCPEASFVVGGIEDVPMLWPETRFDLIVACEVLYYVANLDELLMMLEQRSERLFVSNYRPRSEVIRGHFEREGWRRLPDISHGDAVWECFLWEAQNV